MRFKSILINVTEQCHVGCQHCGYIGSKRDREMSAAEMGMWVEQITRYGISTIIFTGGEAFERYEILQEGVRRAREHHARSAVFTSSFWAVSPSEARKRLEGLEGLHQLYLSTDVYHQKRVSFAHVRNAIQAAIDLNIPRIRLEITYATEADRASVAAEYSAFGDRVEIHADRVIPNPKFSPHTLIGQDPLLDLSPSNYSTKCFLGTPLLNPNGDLFACHVGKAAAHGDLSKLPYFLGNLRENTLQQLLARATARADYQFLRTHGPRGVVEMLQSQKTLDQSLSRRKFTTGCDMCMCALSSPGASNALKAHAEMAKESIDIRLGLMLSEEPAFGTEETAPLADRES